MMWKKIFLVPALLLVSLPNAAGAREKRTSGTRAESYTNRALDAAVGVLSTHEEAEDDGPAHSLVDGNPATKWSSVYTEPQQLALDIGELTSLKKMRILWARDAARDYDIYTSSDGIIWKKIGGKRGARKGPRTDTIRLGNNKMRFIGLDLIKRSGQKGFSISEIEILSTETKTKPSELVRAKVLSAETKEPAQREKTKISKAPVRDETSELRNEIRAVSRKYKELESQRNSSRTQIQRLQKEKGNLAERLADLEAELEKSTESADLIERLSNLEAVLKKSAESKTNDIPDNEDLKKLQEKIQELEEKIKALETQSRKASSEAKKVQRLEYNLSVSNTKLKQLRTRIKNLETPKEKPEPETEPEKDIKGVTQEGFAATMEEVKTIMRQVAKERLDMHYNLAVVYQKHAMYEDAEREYLKCLKTNPNEADVHYNLAILYDDRLNNNDLAGRHYRKFLELRAPGDDPMKVREWMFNVEQEKRLGAEVK